MNSPMLAKSKRGYYEALTAVLLLALGCTAFGGCERRPGPYERAGQRVDEIADNVREGENPLKRKRTGELVGEALDDALDAD